VDSEPIGNFGDVSMFSFHATKVFNAIEGGALVYGTDAYKHKLDLMKNFGIEGPEEISLISYNAKMNEFQALMGLLNLKYLDENIRKRKLVYTAYHKYLQEIPGISLVKTRKDVKSNFAYMPVLVDETKFGLTRDELYDELLGYNVFTRKYFFPLITDTEAYSGCGADIPKAEYVGKRILCLPIFGDMMPEEAVKVCEIIKEISSLRKRSFK
jgi:dTDP-4-amino-4,6-dideoxygalactose transaminase